MQRAVDSDHITLREHLLQSVDPAAANLLLNLGLQGLVVKVQQLLAVEWLEAAQNALADAAHGHSADHLALEVELVLGRCRDVPLAGLDLLVRRHEVAHQDQDRHDDVLGHGHHIGARYFGDRDAAVGLVGCVEVDVVGPDACRDGDLELLGFGQALGGQVARVESAEVRRGAQMDPVETYGVVMMISASTSSLSNVEFSPSLSDVVTSVCP